MRRITHILCPVDFSENSRHAFDCAIGLAKCYGSSVHVLHVVHIPDSTPGIGLAPAPVPIAPAEVDRIEMAMREFLDIEPSGGVQIGYVVVEAPSVAREIGLQAERLSADLLVTGTHGRSGFERFLLGSVAERVLRRSRVPVLTVPPRAPDMAPIGSCPFRNVLYATDFSPGSERAFEYATSLADGTGSRLTLMYVVEQLPVAYDSVLAIPLSINACPESLEQAGRTQLDDLVTISVPPSCETDTVVARGRAAEEILRVAAERQADVIVLGVHGRNALDRLVFGSTAEKVVRQATCPVLTVRESS
jgi:nucleotide-binding universal stress UspA family protein